VTSESVDGGRAFLPAPKMHVELVFFDPSAGRSVKPAAPGIVTDLSQVASDEAGA
jgi:hypothetical protein